MHTQRLALISLAVLACTIVVVLAIKGMTGTQDRTLALGLPTSTALDSGLESRETELATQSLQDSRESMRVSTALELDAAQEAGMIAGGDHRSTLLVETQILKIYGGSSDTPWTLARP